MLANFFVPILDDGWRFIAIFAASPGEAKPSRVPLRNAVSYAAAALG